MACKKTCSWKVRWLEARRRAGPGPLCAADPHDVQVARGGVGAQPLGAAGVQPRGVDPRQESVGDEDLAAPGSDRLIDAVR